MSREKRTAEIKLRVTPTTLDNLKAVSSATGKAVAVLASDYTTMRAAEDAKKLGAVAGPSLNSGNTTKEN